MPSSRVVATFIVSLVLGSALGFAAAYVLYQPQLNRLQIELSSSRAEVSSLQSENALLEANQSLLEANYSRLRKDYLDLMERYSYLEEECSLLNTSYSAIQVPYAELVSKYSALLHDYRELNTSYTLLKAVYNQSGQLPQSMLQHYTVLSSNVTSLYSLLHSYSSVPESFPRVLNNEAVRETASTVISVAGSSKDRWASYEKIYKYVSSNIKYTQDIDMPYISRYWYIYSGGFQYITSFTADVTRNYVQTPRLTLEIKQGDCDDMAVLTYAMIQYYGTFIISTFYDLYIADIQFSNNLGHVAVLMPVSDGTICILDPAGKYLTMEGGQVSSKPALAELRSYSSYWTKDVGGITSMKLYTVDITDGSHKLVVEGNVEQVARALH